MGIENPRTIEVRQPTGCADANGGAVKTMPMPRLAGLVVYGMPGTSDLSARDAISKPLQQQTMEIMQPRDTPLHINHSTWLLMQAGHFIFVYLPPNGPSWRKSAAGSDYPTIHG
jgi:hypothetical protein